MFNDDLVLSDTQDLDQPVDLDTPLFTLLEHKSQLDSTHIVYLSKLLHEVSPNQVDVSSVSVKDELQAQLSLIKSLREHIAPNGVIDTQQFEMSEVKNILAAANNAMQTLLRYREKMLELDTLSSVEQTIISTVEEFLSEDQISLFLERLESNLEKI